MSKMYSNQHEFRKWLKETKQPYIVVNDKPSSVLVNNFEKQKQQKLFENIRNSGFTMKRTPHNVYSRLDFATWLQAGKVNYIHEKHSILPKKQIIQNEYYFQLFCAYQNKYAKQ